MRDMKLSAYVDESPGRQTAIAKLIGCQPQLVWQWSRGVRPVPIERCTAIEQATEHAVMRWDLRPDDWHRIWPELTTRPDAPAMGVPEPAAG
jgi:DNA-binding transcriptional regulator YdaS (Cro superfamily)